MDPQAVNKEIAERITRRREEEVASRPVVHRDTRNGKPKFSVPGFSFLVLEKNYCCALRLRTVGHGPRTRCFLLVRTFSWELVLCINL